MAKILITTIQVNLVPNPSGGGNTNSPELLLLKFLPLTYHHSHFLAATLDFTSFFTIAFLGAALFFYTWLFWIIDFTCFCISIPKAGLWMALGLFNLYFFSLPQEEEKDEADFINTLILILSVNVHIIYTYNTYLLHVD